jgi:ATP-dependent phosphofructokinase / diphosphate-dependent phosphofructokinase
MAKRIGVLSGGGDSSAINAATRAIFLKASSLGYVVIAIKDGWKGLIEGMSDELTREKVSGIMCEGGTILGTSRTNPFKIEGAVEKVKENIEKLGLDAIITIGGDDTNGVITKLTDQVKGIGIPQTIDNDIAYTEYAVGYATAVEVVTDCIDKLHTTAFSHHRVMVIEVMGRDAGFLALDSGIAGGADIILIPEVPYNYDDIVKVIEERKKRDVDFTIIVVAEGAKPAEGPEQIKKSSKVDSFGHVQLGGIGTIIADEIEKRGYETRSTNLGHLQRGGKASAYDRLISTRMGVKAVELIEEGKYGQMVVFKDGKISSVPLEKAINEDRAIDMELYEMTKILH